MRLCVCVYLLRKEFPNALSFLKGFLGSTTRALPGTTPSFSPYITAMKPSVVGSGPIRIPGKSCSNRYLWQDRERDREVSPSHTTLPPILPDRKTSHTEFEAFCRLILSSPRRPLTRFSSLKKSEKGRKRWKMAAASLCPRTSCCRSQTDRRRHQREELENY